MQHAISCTYYVTCFITFMYCRKEYRFSSDKLVLPDVLIIGVRKAGTGALRHFLSLHPDLVVAPREKHFFDFKYERGLEWYASKLPKKQRTDQLLLEKTPRYFLIKNAPYRIANDLPNAKLIVVVREPVARVISEYSHFDYARQKKRYRRPFEVRYKHISSYC